MAEWTEISGPATAWATPALPSASAQNIVSPPLASWSLVSLPTAAFNQVDTDNRQFVVWDPYISMPVSTVWDGGDTTWIE